MQALTVSRDCVLLGLPRSQQPARYTRHKALGNRTLCGIEVAGAQVPDPPDYKPDTAHQCRRCHETHAQMTVPT